jgi:hypothetical protein
MRPTLSRIGGALTGGLPVDMDCHERELLNLDPYDAAMVPSLGGLVLRGMIATHPYMTKTGKKIFGVFVTNKGRAYLSKFRKTDLSLFQRS